MRDYYYGKLFFNYNRDRMDVMYDDGTTENGLHCGQCMDVFINGEWKATRLEMSDDWFLVGIKGLDTLEGLKVRL
jgi:hypothetical protein